MHHWLSETEAANRDYEVALKKYRATNQSALAARCMERGARVLGTNGRPFSEDSIGGALATRSLKEHLRESGIATGGPRALSDKDRSRFLSKLDELVQKSLREA